MLKEVANARSEGRAPCSSRATRSAPPRRRCWHFSSTIDVAHAFDAVTSPGPLRQPPPAGLRLSAAAPLSRGTSSTPGARPWWLPFPAFNTPATTLARRAPSWWRLPGCCKSPSYSLPVAPRRRIWRAARPVNLLVRSAGSGTITPRTFARTRSAASSRRATSSTWRRRRGASNDAQSSCVTRLCCTTGAFSSVVRRRGSFSSDRLFRSPASTFFIPAQAGHDLPHPSQ